MNSVQFSRSVVSVSLRPHGLQHPEPPCPSPTPKVYSNSCPLSRWCHLTISSSVIPFSSCPQSFPASGSFPMSRFFASGGQRIGVSASASVFPMNIQGNLLNDWLVGSPCCTRDSQGSSPAPQLKSNSLVLQSLSKPQDNIYRGRRAFADNIIAYRGNLGQLIFSGKKKKSFPNATTVHYSLLSKHT